MANMVLDLAVHDVDVAASALDQFGGGGIGVSVGIGFVDFILITTDMLDVIFIFAVLPALSDTGPTQLSNSQPSWGITSILTGIPKLYPLSPNGVGLSMNCPAFSGSILTSSLEVNSGGVSLVRGVIGRLVGAMVGVQPEPKTKPSMRAKNKSLISTLYPSRSIWLWT